MATGETTIVSFESPHKLRDMCITESDGAPQAEQIDNEKFNIRMANSEGRREAASVLIRKMYGWRGYSIDDPLGEEHEKPNLITLVADTGGSTVGTMTLCFDTDIGLPADENFQDKLDQLRAQDRRLCEPSKLAIDTNVPKRVFASLIHISYIYAHNIHHYTDYIIEVNPRHAVFYKRMLGFREMGAERMCTRVGAPAVLLRLELDYMGQQILKYGGQMENHGKEKSFYPYFFPPKDEPGITGRLINGQG